MATQFNLTQALQDQVPLSEINRELASQKGFDYDAAFADIKEARRGEVMKDGLSPENISEEELNLFANETILTELSGGKYARVDDPVQRGVTEGLLIDLPSGLAFARGARFEISHRGAAHKGDCVGVPAPHVELFRAVTGWHGGDAARTVRNIHRGQVADAGGVFVE